MDVDRVFDALASPARRQMLRHLSPGEMTTTELAARFPMSAPAVSRHLSVLENAGLVASRRDGQRVLYALVRDTVIEALSGLATELSMGAQPGVLRPRKQRDAI
jgi:ArsR family transcriptional regulator, arsenate/arsenite/antimonite-responsive transcriptional repressor